MKAFCENCRDMMEYQVKSVNFDKEIKGRLVKYVGKMAFCEDCHEELFVPEIRDSNLAALDAAYRIEEKLIEVSDIEKLLLKYDIGKRPLSLLLGWGEGTLTRYLEGDLPTKLYSDQLMKILEDEAFYRDLLERNREKISDVAYRKSVKAVQEGSFHSGLKLNKLESAACYLLRQTSEITPLALQKLLYFAQGFQMAFTGKFLFQEDCEAWIHGPVYREIYFRYKSYGFTPIEEKDIPLHNLNLEEEEQELLHQIVVSFGCYSGKVLEAMTHTEEPWRIARAGLREGDSSDRLIRKSDMEVHFRTVKEKYQMLNIADIKDYSKDLFQKLC